ncbi:MAG: hypothetical protein WB767_15415 [Nocardioides sp.]
MRDDDEFASYAHARWPTLVRVVRVMGAGPRHATVVGQETCRSLHQRWSQRNEWFDLDVELYREVVAAWGRTSYGWWAEPNDVSTATGYADLEPLLDRLDPIRRWRLALEAVAGLSEDDAALVVGRLSDPPHSAPVSVGHHELFAAAQAFAVGPAQISAAIADDEARRRRSRRISLVTVGAVALVGAAFTPAAVDYFDRADDGRDPVPRVIDPDSLVPRPNQGPDGVVLTVPWFVEGMLRLGNRAYDVGLVTGLAEVPGGAIVQLADGTLARVRADDGRQILIGASRPGSAFATSAATGWAAWITPGPRPEVVVADESSERLRGTLNRGEQVIALEGRATYLAGPDGYRVLRPGGPQTEVPLVGLVDVAARSSVVKGPGEFLRVQREGGDDLLVRGEGARLSDTGEFLLTRVGEPGTSQDLVVIEVATGQRVTLALPDSGTGVGAAFGPENSVTFLFVNDEMDSIDDPRMADQPAYDLVTCFLRTRSCAAAGRVTTVSERPLLAQ